MGDLIKFHSQAITDAELLLRARAVGEIIKAKIAQANDLILEADIVGSGLNGERNFFKRWRLVSIRDRKLKEVDLIKADLEVIQEQANKILDAFVGEKK